MVHEFEAGFDTWLSKGQLDKLKALLKWHKGQAIADGNSSHREINFHKAQVELLEQILPITNRQAASRAHHARKRNESL